MLNITRNITYCGDCYIETPAGNHVTVATMTAVLSDNNFLNISMNIVDEGFYDNCKDVIDEDWKEFADEIYVIMDNYTDGVFIPGSTTEPGPEEEEPDDDNEPDDGDGDNGDDGDGDGTNLPVDEEPGPVVDDDDTPAISDESTVDSENGDDE